MDVEAWLQTLEPRVMDAWLAFAEVDPDAFEASPGRKPAGESPRGELLDASEAARRMAKRLGG